MCRDSGDRIAIKPQKFHVFNTFLGDVGADQRSEILPIVFSDLGISPHQKKNGITALTFKCFEDRSEIRDSSESFSDPIHIS